MFRFVVSIDDLSIAKNILYRYVWIDERRLQIESFDGKAEVQIECTATEHKAIVNALKEANIDYEVCNDN